MVRGRGVRGGMGLIVRDRTGLDGAWPGCVWAPEISRSGHSYGWIFDSGIDGEGRGGRSICKNTVLDIPPSDLYFIPMYNHLTKLVTCDTCRATVPAERRRVQKIATELEPLGWEYTGFGHFACPKCTKKTPAKKTRAKS